MREPLLLISLSYGKDSLFSVPEDMRNIVLSRIRRLGYLLRRRYQAPKNTLILDNLRVIRDIRRRRHNVRNQLYIRLTRLLVIHAPVNERIDKRNDINRPVLKIKILHSEIYLHMTINIKILALQYSRNDIEAFRINKYRPEHRLLSLQRKRQLPLDKFALSHLYLSSSTSTTTLPVTSE